MKTLLKLSTSLLLLALLAPAAPLLADKGDAPPAVLEQNADADAVARGAGTITGERLLATVRWLAAPERQGRLAGGPGYLASAREMARRFAALGLQPGGEDGYLQHLTLEYNEIVAPVHLALVEGGREAKAYRLGPDFVCRGFSGGGDATAPVIFCGYGLSLPERGYDDYAGVDVTGKIVLAFKQAPQWRLDDEEGWQRADTPRPKARTARDHGAVGLLLASLPAGDETQPLIGSVLHGPGEQDPGFPAVHVGQHVAADLLAGSGATLAGLRAAIDSTRAPASRPLATSVRLQVTARHDPERDTANVVAILPGQDPELQDECLVIGAHLDHVGEQAGELLFPGAHDNASGAAAVLEVAGAFARGGVAPRRSIVFVLFAGEEQGLFGARHYAANPVRPLERTVAMINLDCVARGDSIQMGGGGLYPQLWGLARAQDAAGAARTIARTWPGGGADAQPFHEAGVPTLYFHTTSGYDHLHAPEDTPETLDPELHSQVARLVFRTAAAVAAGSYEREAPAEPAATTAH